MKVYLSLICYLVSGLLIWSACNKDEPSSTQLPQIPPSQTPSQTPPSPPISSPSVQYDGPNWSDQYFDYYSDRSFKKAPTGHQVHVASIRLTPAAISKGIFVFGNRTDGEWYSYVQIPGIVEGIPLTYSVDSGHVYINTILQDTIRKNLLFSIENKQ